MRKYLIYYTFFSHISSYVVFCKYFWTKLQVVFGHCCMSILDKVAEVSWQPLLTTAGFHCKQKLFIRTHSCQSY